MNMEDVAKAGLALRAAANVLLQDARSPATFSASQNLGAVLNEIVTALDRHIAFDKNGGIVQALTVCGCCGDMGEAGPAGWLISPSHGGGIPGAAVPLCDDCADKALNEPQFIKEFADSHGFDGRLYFEHDPLAPRVKRRRLATGGRRA